MSRAAPFEKSFEVLLELPAGLSRWVAGHRQLKVTKLACGRLRKKYGRITQGKLAPEGAEPTPPVQWLLDVGEGRQGVETGAHPMR
jgi:hypothetical protein